MDIGNIYHEDGIEFSLVKRYKDKLKAREIAKQINTTGYYARVKHFYNTAGEVLFYGVIMSTKPKLSSISYKILNNDPFSKNPESDIIRDFLTAKQRMSKIDFTKIVGKSSKRNVISNTNLKITSGSGCFFNENYNLVLIGTKNLDFYSRRMIRTDIVHELIHAVGYRHGTLGHSYGYYSKVSRDELTPLIMEKIGWKFPEHKEWVDSSKAIHKEEYEKRKENANYIIYCEKCGWKQYRIKKSRVIEETSKYICPKCKSKSLKSKEL